MRPDDVSCKNSFMKYPGVGVSYAAVLLRELQTQLLENLHEVK